MLWIALVVNAAMAAVEIGSGLGTGSVALLADAVDFFGDAANYGLALAVLALAPIWRAPLRWQRAHHGAFGVFVLGRAAWSAAHGIVPDAMPMGAIGALALLANLGVAWMLYAWRDGDANMRSVWLCTRNDAIGNVAVDGGGARRVRHRQRLAGSRGRARHGRARNSRRRGRWWAGAVGTALDARRRAAGARGAAPS